MNEERLLELLDEVECHTGSIRRTMQANPFNLDQVKREIRLDAGFVETYAKKLVKFLDEPS